MQKCKLVLGHFLENCTCLGSWQQVSLACHDSRFSILQSSQQLALSCGPTSAPSSVHLIPASHSAQRCVKDHGRHTHFLQYTSTTLKFSPFNPSSKIQKRSKKIHSTRLRPAVRGKLQGFQLQERWQRAENREEQNCGQPVFRCRPTMNT